MLDWNATALEVSALFSLTHSPNRSRHDVATEFPAPSYAAAFSKSLCPEEQDATEKIVNTPIKKSLINLMKNACHSPRNDDIFSKMKNVFIDTNIFIGKRFDAFNDTDFAALSEYIKNEKVKLFSHKVVVNEIKKHFRSDISAGFDQYTSFFSKLKLLRGSGFSGFDRPATKDEMIEKGFSLIDTFFHMNNAVILDYSEIEISSIFDDYFACKPPFEDGGDKKAEFPDAVIVASVKNSVP